MGQGAVDSETQAQLDLVLILKSRSPAYLLYTQSHSKAG